MKHNTQCDQVFSGQITTSGFKNYYFRSKITTSGFKITIFGLKLPRCHIFAIFSIFFPIFPYFFQFFHILGGGGGGAKKNFSGEKLFWRITSKIRVKNFFSDL